MLAGTVCCQTGAPSDFETCVDRCRGRGCEFPLPLLVSMQRNGEKRIGAGFSATTILQCPTLTILKDEYDFYESPAVFHARWRGTGVHAMAEADGPYEGVIQETRIRKSIDILGQPVVITGQPDWFDTGSSHLDDWKSTGKCPTSPYDDHKAQINIYAWLIDGGVWDTGEISDYHVETASIVYIDPTRSKIAPVELWTNQATEDMIRRKLEPVIRYYSTGDMPGNVLTGSDGWKRRFCPFSGTGKCCSDGELRESADT